MRFWGFFLFIRDMKFKRGTNFQSSLDDRDFLSAWANKREVSSTSLFFEGSSALEGRNEDGKYSLEEKNGAAALLVNKEDVDVLVKVGRIDEANGWYEGNGNVEDVGDICGSVAADVVKEEEGVVDEVVVSVVDVVVVVVVAVGRVCCVEGLSWFGGRAEGASPL
jgi:hypothetical protein